jgi:hypothetical protein
MLYVGSRGDTIDSISWLTNCAYWQPISKNAITILVNLSHDDEVVKTLAEDDAFLETLLKKITVCE